MLSKVMNRSLLACLIGLALALTSKVCYAVDNLLFCVTTDGRLLTLNKQTAQATQIRGPLPGKYQQIAGAVIYNNVVYAAYPFTGASSSIVALGPVNGDEVNLGLVKFLDTSYGLYPTIHSLSKLPNGDIVTAVRTRVSSDKLSQEFGVFKFDLLTMTLNQQGIAANPAVSLKVVDPGSTGYRHLQKEGMAVLNQTTGRFYYVGRYGNPVVPRSQVTPLLDQRPIGGSGWTAYGISDFSPLSYPTIIADMAGDPATQDTAYYTTVDLDSSLNATSSPSKLYKLVWPSATVQPQVTLIGTISNYKACTGLAFGPNPTSLVSPAPINPPQPVRGNQAWEPVRMFLENAM